MDDIELMADGNGNDAFSASDGVENGKKRRGINSVETGIKVLEAVIQIGGASSLKAIAEMAGMESSQTHRYVSSLLNTGLLTQNTESGLYDLGPRALHIGLAAMARMESLNQVEAAAALAAQETKATILVLVWGSAGPTIVGWHDGSPPIFTNLAIGSALPLTTSASGKIFMSYLPEGHLDSVLKKEGWSVPFSDNARLMRSRAKTRARTWASVDGSFIPGLCAYSVPVFGLGNKLAAVLTAVATSDNPYASDPDFRVGLIRRSKILTRELGGAWPRPALEL